jgi:2-hydroxymuconate-semialdehyde hydrolase
MVDASTTFRGTVMNEQLNITTRAVEVGDHRFHFNECGDPNGPAVLWLHGSGPGVTALSNWSGVVGALGHLRNLAPDMIGFGDSSHPVDPPQGMVAWTDLRAETIVGLLDALGLASVHLVGNSMGGMVGLNIIKRWPERIDRLVLMGSGGAPVPPGPALGNMLSFYDDPSNERLLAMLRDFVVNPDAMAEQLQHVADERLARVMRDDVRRSHLSTFNIAAPMGPIITEDEVRAITSPVLIVHGREDRMLSVDGAYWLAQRIPNAQLHTFPNTGHWIQIEEHERFCFIVDAFLAGRL